MPIITLAAPLARWLPGSPHGDQSFRVPGATVRAVIEQFLLLHPTLRGYILDDQGTLRHHIAAFVDAVVVRDKVGLTESVPGQGELYLVQALSGG